MSIIGNEQLKQWEKQQVSAVAGKKPYGVKISKLRLFNDLAALSDTEKVIYISLLLFKDREGYCYPSMRYLGNLLGHDKNTIQKYIWALKKKGFLEIKKRWGKLGKAYGYRLLK